MNKTEWKYLPWLIENVLRHTKCALGKEVHCTWNFTVINLHSWWSRSSWTDLLAQEGLCVQQREVCAVSQGYTIYVRSHSDVKGTRQHHRSGCCHCVWLLVKECRFQTCDSCFAFLAVEQCSGLTLASDFDTSDRAQNKRQIILLYCEGMTFLTPQPWCWQEGQIQ